MEIIGNISSLVGAALLLWVVLDLNRIKSRLDSIEKLNKKEA